MFSLSQCIYEDGLEEGIEKGLEQGEDMKLIVQVQRKLRKRKPLAVIAEELEEPLANVERISETVLHCGMDAEPQEIYDEMQKIAPVQ